VSTGQAAFQPSGRGGDQEYIRLNEAVRANIARLSDAISQYKKLSDQMGTARDTPELRQRLYARTPTHLHTHAHTRADPTTVGAGTTLPRTPRSW
jgi:hypothetical protein